MDRPSDESDDIRGLTVTCNSFFSSEVILALGKSVSTEAAESWFRSRCFSSDIIEDSKADVRFDDRDGKKSRQGQNTWSKMIL